MKTNNVYVDIHAIQTVPPSNINRDDTGSPKTAQYGGVTRSRVSSQSWKKAIRQYFEGTIKENNFAGKRSLNIVSYIAKKIIAQDTSIDETTALTMANDILNLVGVTTKDFKVKALFFIGEKQAEELAGAAIQKIKDKKVLQSMLKDNPSVDIALFGRMVADDPTLNEDASAQVAHSISTHSVQTEFDFFTATDDLAAEDNAGAGMLGTLEFNSSTLYRYANVAAHELLLQLDKNKEATIETLKIFVEAFVKSMPTGKINTFANQTLPQAIVVSIRQDRPVNLVTAFESPVKSENGYVKGSIEKLKGEFISVQKMIEAPYMTYCIGIEGLGEEQENLKILLEEFAKGISQVLQ